MPRPLLQAEFGENTTTKPSLFSVTESAKWRAWKDLADMPKMEAMRLFVKALEVDHADWWRSIPPPEPEEQPAEVERPQGDETKPDEKSSEQGDKAADAAAPISKKKRAARPAAGVIVPAGGPPPASISPKLVMTARAKAAGMRVPGKVVDAGAKMRQLEQDNRTLQNRLHAEKAARVQAEAHVTDLRQQCAAKDAQVAEMRQQMEMVLSKLNSTDTSGAGGWTTLRWVASVLTLGLVKNRPNAPAADLAFPPALGGGPRVPPTALPGAAPATLFEPIGDAAV